MSETHVETVSDSKLAPDLIMVQINQNYVACEECDTLFRKSDLYKNERAYCSACGSELYRKIPKFNTLLALVCTALIIFAIANSFSIVKVELQGIYSETTLLGAAWAMFEADRAFVGFLILMTTFVVPLAYLLLMGYILLMAMFNKNVIATQQYASLKLALRSLFQLRAWGMVEVFLIGVLVTLVKLVGMVVVIPGIALWAFAILSVLLVYLVSIKIKDLWNVIDGNQIS